MGEEEFEGLSKEEALEEIANVMGESLDHPYFNKNHPNHGRWVERICQLHEIAYPEGEGDVENLKTKVKGANAEIERLYADEKFMKVYNNKDHPGHQEAVNRMYALQQKANPEPGEEEEDVELDDEALTKQEKEELEKIDDEMKKTFGAEYEEVSELSAVGVDFVKEEFPNLLDTLETPGPDGKALGNNPEVVRVFASLGQLVRKAKEGGGE